MPAYNTCPCCGANLDPGERCEDCYQKESAGSKCHALIVVPQPLEVDPVSELEAAIEGDPSDWNISQINELAQATKPAILSAELQERIAAAFALISEIVDMLAAKIREVVKAIVDAVLPVFKWFWESIVQVIVPQKWWHFYKHSKKARIRNKYRKRIEQQYLLCLRV